MKEIQLTSGKVALVDNVDFEELTRYKWRAVRHHNTWYAVRDVGHEGRRHRLRMHRVLLNAPDTAEVDHINGNGLDNRRENLRLCTHTQNRCNTGITRANSSGFKGVCWHKGKQLWLAHITVQKKQRFLGYFRDPTEAARAYDAVAQECFGEFARTNF